MISASTMPRGTLRVGSLTSAPAVEIASSPMNEKNTVPAALTPAAPAPQNASNRSPS